MPLLVWPIEIDHHVARGVARVDVVEDLGERLGPAHVQLAEVLDELGLARANLP